jgi:hypothetical protein
MIKDAIKKVIAFTNCILERLPTYQRKEMLTQKNDLQLILSGTDF